MGDHYLTLGVSRSASEREIARAHRRLARRYHPDVSATPTATLELFLAVQDAYETLSDARRRASYDLELNRGEQEQPASAAARFVAQPARAPAKTVVPEMRHARAPLDAHPSTIALVLVATASVALLVAVALENALVGGTRFLYAGVCVALGVVASMLARWMATRQLEQLWRWSAREGRGLLRKSRAARAASHRIQLADYVTLLGRRAALISIPIVFLLAQR